MAEETVQRPSLSRQLLPAVHGMLARPLSSYYLLVSSSGLLLLIGLTMVFSATSVKAYADHGNAYGAIGNQAVYALLGLFGFWVCQRLPARTLRALGKYILGIALALLAILDMLMALESIHVLKSAKIGPIHAQLLWLYLGPIGIQPSELAKLGVVLWGADLIARKGASLGHWRELAMPLFPMVGLLFVLVGYNDLGTMLIILALVVGLLWAAGVRLRIFAALGVLGLSGVGLLIAAASRGAGSGSADGPNYRLARLTSFPSRRRTATSALATSCCRAGRRSTRVAGSASGWARARSSGTGCRTRRMTSSSRWSPRSSAWSAARWCWRCSRCWRTPVCGSPAGSRIRSGGWPPPPSPPGWSPRP
jgi:cell division protein FtsW